ncbi:serine/threonine-protein kinase [Anatilimnocola floriformis]|uniref:serine/threonine-protein kinase n=1 Tax=Anatilimnocola floriformis TaxID=2948575 RepID=UPI0020C3D935|nr:serine/threonine-protein kinase [Anatilimnocola floriformis]
MSDNQLLRELPAGTLNLAPDSTADGTRCLILPAKEEVAVAALAASPVQQRVPLPPTMTRPRVGSNDPWIGRTLREYQFEEFLGAGAMGRVYRARHRWLDMNVAIKLLKEDLYEDENCVARFRREAIASARLNHPNIVRACDGGLEGNTLFLVTEFVPGESLAKVLQDRDQLSIADVCAIICQAAAALQHAHEQGMVHRDIKPSNMMLSATGQVKLLDLGLARFSQGHATLTETGHVMGTLDFMAPEQAGDSRHVDIRADIYSLGCTLYCLLTGVPPFSGPAYDTPVSKMLAHSDSEPPAVSLRRKKTPAPVLACLQKMMEKDKNQRYSRPAEIVTALQPFAAGARLAELAGGQQVRETAYAPQQAPSQVISTIDWLADVIFDGAWVVLRTICCMVGLLERRQQPSPLTGAPGKTLYEISPKGLASVLVLAAVVAFLYCTGFRIYFY